jgi:bacillithiol system protein YtxJ
MDWISLENESQLDEIITLSGSAPQVIFKHSTRCSVSSMVKNRLDKDRAPGGITFYFLDLIQYRNISNQIAQYFNIRHQSPQVLVIQNGKCTYTESHYGITMEDIESAAMIS